MQALNTFIDDLFAFIIKMPTMHRLSCLRDDVIFVVYLYQRYVCARVRLFCSADRLIQHARYYLIIDYAGRWCYGIDHTRPNEYGQVGEGEQGDERREIPGDRREIVGESRAGGAEPSAEPSAGADDAAR